MSESENQSWLNWVQNMDLKVLEEEPFSSWTPKLKETLTPKRYRHVLGVTRTAQALSQRYGQNVKQAITAAYLHDCAKKNEAFYFARLKEMGILEDKDYRPSPTYHAFLGGYVARYFYGVKDPAVIQAIQAHTLGSKTMSKLDKIIFLADLIEPGRSFDGLEELRLLSLKGLTKGTLAAFDHTLTYLIESGSEIELLSVEARNALIREIQGENPPQKR